jgi:hypothetical protein
MAANTWQIGDIKITAVIELEDVGGTIQSIIPEATAKRLEEMTWLQPQFVERDGSMLASVNTFLVETEEVKIDQVCQSGGIWKRIIFTN